MAFRMQISLRMQATMATLNSLPASMRRWYIERITRVAVRVAMYSEVDKMLEGAQEVTREGDAESVRYTRFADDLVVQVSSSFWRRHWAAKVEKRLREELGKLGLRINEEKSRIVNFGAGEPFEFLGYT